MVEQHEKGVCIYHQMKEQVGEIRVQHCRRVDSARHDQSVGFGLLLAEMEQGPEYPNILGYYLYLKRKNEHLPSLKGSCVLEHRGISSAVNTTDHLQRGHSSIVFSR